MKLLNKITMALPLVAVMAMGSMPLAYANDSEGNDPMHAAVGNSLKAGVKVSPQQGWTYTLASWNDACEFGALPQIKIVSAPEHGSISLGTGEHVVKNPNSICQGSPIEGTSVSYQPAKGFHGTDHLTYEVAYQATEDGPMLSQTYTVPLNVQ